MEASTGILRRLPFSGAGGVGVGVGKDPFGHSSRLSCSRLEMGMGVKLENRKLIMGCGFCDEGYLEYYSSGRGGGRIVKCGVKGKKEMDLEMKKTKKKMKLLKGLSKNLSELGVGFAFDVALVDQVQGKTISEAADLLLGQLQQLKAEEKALKRKRKEEKALMKMKAASQLQDTRNCEMSSSSSSSSESSDDECQNMVDMKSMKIETLAQTIPEACDRALENATLNPALPIVVEPQTLNPEADISVEISTTSTSLEVPAPEQKGECCMEASDCHIGNASVAAAATTTTAAAGTKRIEVCMGGKCKRLGAGAILDELQRAVGIEAAVSGCKCMGKCKVGPNVKLSGCSSSSSNSDAFQAADSISVSSAPSLCIGVGLEDVSMIAANLLGGRFQEVGMTNAMA